MHYCEYCNKIGSCNQISKHVYEEHLFESPCDNCMEMIALKDMEIHYQSCVNSNNKEE